MKRWQINIEKILSGAAAPPVLNRSLLSRIARSANDGIPVPPATLSRWIKHAREHEKLQPVMRGLWLNRYRSIPPQNADAIQYLRRDAIVSLYTVLADAGILNNPVHAVTAVVPFDRSGPKPKLGRVNTQAGIFHFYGLPREILEAGRVEDRIDNDPHHEHIRATPEKALTDWLYFSSSPYSNLTAPNPVDIDLNMLNLPQLKRLAKSAGVLPELEKWMKQQG